jgi:large subunit ribosomal protein L21
LLPADGKAKRGTAVYAVVRTGGKQYRVAEADLIRVEKLEGAPGDSVELTDVLMVVDGDEVKIGTPVVDGARVTATVVRQTKGRKIDGLTYEKTKRHRRRFGHRQLLTELRIEKIAS